MGGAAPAATAPAAAASVLSSSSPSSSWASTLLSKDARYAMAGGLAGATAKTCTAPLARLTILYQVEGAARAGGSGAPTTTTLPRSVPAALASLVRREGVLALWRGNGVTILHRLPYSSINFWAYERSFAALDAAFPEKEKGSGGGGSVGGSGSSQSSSSARAFGKRLAAGAVAGGVACAAAYPLDLVRTRLAAQVGGGGGGGARGSSSAAVSAATATAATAPPPQPQQQLYYRGVWGTLSTIARDEGLLGLYRGLGATLVQVVPTLGLNFGLYETSKAMVRQRREQKQREARRAGAAASGEEGGGGEESGDKKKAEALPPAATLACGCISGFVTATATFPLDVVRRRMQVAGRRAAGGEAAEAGASSPSSSSSSPSPPAPSRPSYAQVARDVVRQGGGLGGFYRGIGAEYCKVVPGVAIAFFVYESAKNALGVGSGGGGGGQGGGGERR